MLKIQSQNISGKPDILFIMCDQLRADTLAFMGDPVVQTPNFDRLYKRGLAFTKAYSSCPVCVPARYTIRTGCEPYTMGWFGNGRYKVAQEMPEKMEDRCGSYLARTMNDLGYRTFGVGKFHTHPWNEDVGYEVQLHSEELWGTEQRKKDAYAAFIAQEHPEFNYIEQLHGERTEMYYMPQTSPLPKELTVEAWAADRAVEQLMMDDSRPVFGFISFVGPHPPCAPPIPYNRMYDPDIVSNPVRGDMEVDAMDEQISFMNHAIWAEDVNDSQARVLKSRYYGEISYIDNCLGKILDAVEARGNSDNTLICFFSDHGDHLGDHSAWQKETFFDVSCKIPFLVSWPAKLSATGQMMDELACLTDLFGIATSAAGSPEIRDGADVLGMLLGHSEPREYVFGFYEIPGTRYFKAMVRSKDWKYIYMANGGREQLFNLTEDPRELTQMIDKKSDVAALLRDVLIEELTKHPGLNPALKDGSLVQFEFEARPLRRIRQFDTSRGVQNFTITNRKNKGE